MVRQTLLSSMWFHQCSLELGRVPEGGVRRGGVLEGGLHADPAWHDN